MRNVIPLLLALCFGGQAVADTVLEFTGFDALEVRNDIVAQVGVATDFEASVTGDDQAQLITAQFGEWLRLDRNKRWLIWTNGRQDRFEATVNMPMVRELKALSGATVTAVLGTQSQFRAEAEDAMITVSVDTPALRIRGNDGAQITVTGTCGRLTMLARPTSRVDLLDLACESIVIFGDQSRVALPAGANVVDAHPEN